MNLIIGSIIMAIGIEAGSTNLSDLSICFSAFESKEKGECTDLIFILVKLTSAQT